MLRRVLGGRLASNGGRERELDGFIRERRDVQTEREKLRREAVFFAFFTLFSFVL